MSDDLNNKFAQISELLNQEGMAENIKGLIGMLSKSTESQQSSEKDSRETEHEKAEPVSKEDKPKSTPSSREIEQDLEMMRQVQKVMEVMRSSKDDPRLNLLNAIKPYMNPSRQKKVSTAMRMLQMTSLTKLIDKDGKSLFKL